MVRREPNHRQLLSKQYALYVYYYCIAGKTHLVQFNAIARRRPWAIVSGLVGEKPTSLPMVSKLPRLMIRERRLRQKILSSAKTQRAFSNRSLRHRDKEKSLDLTVNDKSSSVKAGTRIAMLWHAHRLALRPL